LPVVLDASALIAFFRDEPGAETVKQLLHESTPTSAGKTGLLSTVNLAEVLAALPAAEDDALLSDRGPVDVQPFTAKHAQRAAELRVSTRTAGLSLADRSCVALALSQEPPCAVVTADGAWTTLNLGVTVHHIRPWLLPGARPPRETA